MPRSLSVFVRILLSFSGVLALAMAALMSAAATPPAAPASGHEHHHPPAGPPATAPAAPMSGTGPGSAVTTPSWFLGGESLYVPPYYDVFPGIDLTSLTAPQRERFLHRVNIELCSCNQTGCRRDTIAHCLVTDTSCPRAPVRIREILAQVKDTGKGQGSPSASTVISVTPRP
jgi:hypothetical protein